MLYLDYGEREIGYLSKKDKKLGAYIESKGFIECRINGDLFGSLVGSIATQQISNRAADTVMRRMYEKLGSITTETIGAASAEEIKSAGISMKKAMYIKGLYNAIMTGDLDIEKLREMPEEEISSKLLKIKGIGNWTVEMFLIFSLGRMNIISYGDYAIRKGMMLMYGLKELDRARFERYRKRYSPYCTVASLYLWALSEER